MVIIGKCELSIGLGGDHLKGTYLQINFWDSYSFIICWFNPTQSWGGKRVLLTCNKLQAPLIIIACARTLDTVTHHTLPFRIKKYYVENV